jgi:hypothetical protein
LRRGKGLATRKARGKGEGWWPPRARIWVRVEDSIDGLGREMRVSALDGERIFSEIRAIEELRMVGRNTVVVGGPLPDRENVWEAGQHVQLRVRL